MSQVELLTRAIERLETLKAESTPGPLEAANAGDVFTDLGATNAHGVHADVDDGWQVASFTGGMSFVSGCLEDMPLAEERANRDLFLTLHRTIDPLLELLRGALRYVQAVDDSPHEVVCGIAHAVLGDDV